jgi:hypothetical protein
MKWSLLISWLNDKGRGSALGFLSGVPVDRSRWFPTWVRTRPDLRFRRWDAIAFYADYREGKLTHISRVSIDVSPASSSSSCYPVFGAPGRVILLDDRTIPSSFSLFSGPESRPAWPRAPILIRRWRGGNR